MIENLQFYGTIALLCLFGTGIFRTEEKKELSVIPWIPITILVVWILLSAAYISYWKSPHFTFLEALPKSLDVRYYKSQPFIFQKSSALAAHSFVTMVFFATLFMWGWFKRNQIRNKRQAYQADLGNADKPHS